MGRKTLISFNLWKYIEKHYTARNECTAKHKNKASYNTDFIYPDLIVFFNYDWKAIKRRLKKEIFIFVKKSILLTKNWFVVSNFWEFPKHHTEK